MHLTNQGLSDTQLDVLLSSCRKLRELLSKKEVMIGSAVQFGIRYCTMFAVFIEGSADVLVS